jgi:hypothetical protein
MVRITFVNLLLAAWAPTSNEEERMYSGPQPGEPITAFRMRTVFDEAGAELDPVGKAAGRPILLVFVHQANRPSVAVTRAVMTYVSRRAKDGLHGAVVWLADDATEAEAFIKRARHALPTEAPIGIALDGAEGPGQYGLNRNVTLTILLAKNNRVVANFALVQPSVQADVPKILAEIVKLMGGKAPSLSELLEAAGPAGKRPMQPSADRADPKLREWFRPLLNREASDADVDKAATAIDAYAAKSPEARKQIREIARRIVESGKLGDYGGKRAQEHLRRWAKPDPKPRKDDADHRSSATKS